VSISIKHWLHPPSKQPCEIRTIGETDRIISELKWMLDHPERYDQATFQTIKHHVEDMELFTAYARGRLAIIKGLPPTAVQRERGY
jgi:hypothetical protein